MPYAVITVHFEPYTDLHDGGCSTQLSIYGITPDERAAWGLHHTHSHETTSFIFQKMGDRTAVVPQLLNFFENFGYEVVNSTVSHLSNIIRGNCNSRRTKDLYTWILHKSNVTNEDRRNFVTPGSDIDGVTVGPSSEATKPGHATVYSQTPVIYHSTTSSQTTSIKQANSSSQTPTITQSTAFTQTPSSIKSSSSLGSPDLPSLFIHPSLQNHGTPSRQTPSSSQATPPKQESSPSQRPPPPPPTPPIIIPRYVLPRQRPVSAVVAAIACRECRAIIEAGY